MRTLFYKPILFERFDRESFGRRLSHNLRHWGIVYLLLIVAAALFQTHFAFGQNAVSYTHIRTHESVLDLVCRLIL